MCVTFQESCLCCFPPTLVILSIKKNQYMCQVSATPNSDVKTHFNLNEVLHILPAFFLLTFS
jgi:hypothetical protein